ncbi:MAG: hypothetical protein WCB12_18260 [Bryobacteraceae bacterium]
MEPEKRAWFTFEFLRSRRRRFTRNRGIQERLVGAFSAWDAPPERNRARERADLYGVAQVRSLTAAVRY